MRRAVVLGLSLVLAGCGPSGSVNPSPSSTSQPPPPTPSATAPVEAEPTAEPSPPPVMNGRIAFRRFLDADKLTGEIFAINPDGTGLQQVTTSPADVVSTEPSWSADGQWIVYMVAPTGNLDDARLAKIRPDGTDATDLAGACPEGCSSDGFPAFAPSGELIAFERILAPADDAEFNLRVVFVMDSDGGNARQITQLGANMEQLNPDDGGPTFAPTGELIAFNRRDPDTGLSAIFTVALDGSDEFQVTPWDLDASQPDFSPDGAWILFRSHESTNTMGNVWLVRPDGTDAHAVTDSVDGEAKWLSGSFSPDGLWITNGMTPILNGDQQPADVYIMRLDGSEILDVTDDLTFWDSAPEWGPPT